MSTVKPGTTFMLARRSPFNTIKLGVLFVGQGLEVGEVIWYLLNNDGQVRTISVDEALSMFVHSETTKIMEPRTVRPC